MPAFKAEESIASASFACLLDALLLLSRSANKGGKGFRNGTTRGAGDKPRQNDVVGDEQPCGDKQRRGRDAH